MGEKVRNVYQFPVWVVFIMKSGYELPITFVETSVDGNSVYIEPTEKEGFKTIESLRHVRALCPEIFPNIIGETLIDIPTPYELSQLLAETERAMNLKIHNSAHTLRFLRELNTYERVLVSVEKFLNNSLTFSVN